MEQWLNIKQQFISYTEKALYASLIDEVSTTPKPGLVDRWDSGAHSDMDFHTFEVSTKAITPFLTSMAALGMNWQECGQVMPGHTKEESLFLSLRTIGIRAEAAMFAATGGVNTHKGMIFSMGMIAAASGYHFTELISAADHTDSDGHPDSGGHRDSDDHPDSGSHDSLCLPSLTLQGERILSLCSDMCRKPLEADFSAISASCPGTHGERLYVRYGCRGIRGEAADGFPSVKGCSLPVLRREAQTIHAGIPSEWNRICLKTLLELMAHVDDTNVLYRTDYNSLLYARECAKKVLSANPVINEAGIKMLQCLNADFIKRNISPGGCADLLAITLFLWRMEQFGFAAI